MKLKNVAVPNVLAPLKESSCCRPPTPSTGAYSRCYILQFCAKHNSSTLQEKADDQFNKRLDSFISLESDFFFCRRLLLKTETKKKLSSTSLKNLVKPRTQTRRPLSSHSFVIVGAKLTPCAMPFSNLLQ